MNAATLDILLRISAALQAAREALQEFTPGNTAHEFKKHDNPVTEADRRVNTVLQQMLPRDDEGWFSEETADTESRLGKRRLWVVDPVDGTKEFIAGIPEWVISIAYVVDGNSVAGGICNPQTSEVFLGAVGGGLTYNGTAVSASACKSLSAATVLASRSEVKRGQWEQFKGQRFTVRPVGSVAYKLALVAAGIADATWTLVPKNEWDIAAGAALVAAGGGNVYTLDGRPPRFNQEDSLVSGFVAHAPNLRSEIQRLLHIPRPALDRQVRKPEEDGGAPG